MMRRWRKERQSSRQLEMGRFRVARDARGLKESQEEKKEKNN